MVNTLRTNTSPRLPHSDPDLEEASRGWDLAGLTDTEIDDHIAGLSGRINAAMCEWLGYLAEADRRGVWSGFSTPGAWLSWRCGIGAGTAADHLRIARALVDLPLIRSHFARGAIS